MKHYFLFLVLLILGCSNDFKKAEEFYLNKDYSNAKNCCNLIAKGNKNYSKAQIILVEIDSIENTQFYKSAKTAFYNNNFSYARNEFSNVRNSSFYFDSSRYYLSIIDTVEKDYNIKIEQERIIREEKEKKLRDARARFLKNIIGKKYVYPKSTDIISKYGSPQTLNGTNGIEWIAYFPKGDFTILMSKKTSRINFVKDGRIPNLKKPIDIFKETKSLYLELMNFKNSSGFKNYGFMPGYKYHSWLKKVEKYENYPEAKNLLNKGIVLGELKMLGLEYVSSKGKETEFTRITRQNFKKALF